jgi:ribosome-associated protein
MATKAAALKDKADAKAATAKRQETRRMVLAAAAACEDKKAEDIRILELDPADSGFTDFFLIASGTNERQVQAIGDAIEMQMKREFGTYANSVEGRRQSEWILIDYVDFVCHIFSAEKRAFYDIERLRKSARQVDLQQLKAALSEKTTEVREAAAKKASTKKTASVKTAPKKASSKPAAAKKKSAVKKAVAKKAPAKKAAVKKAAKKKSAK